MDAEYAQVYGEAHGFFPFVKVPEQQQTAFAVADAAALGIKMTPNAHDILFAPAHAPPSAAIVSQPVIGTASADGDPLAGSCVQVHPIGNINAESYFVHVFALSLGFYPHRPSITHSPAWLQVLFLSRPDFLFQKHP